MSSLTAPPLSSSIDTLLRQAKTAVEQGKKQQARHLLQQAIRQDPQDYRGWLWLATVVQSPQASLEYVTRAEMLAPDNVTVQKARRWAEKRLQQAKRETPSTQASLIDQLKQWVADPRLRWATAGLVLLLFVVASLLFTWRYFQSDDLTETAVLNNSLITDSQENLEIEEAVPPVAAAVHPKPTATQTPQPHVPAKQIASTGSDQPRPTWTITPTPSPTPTPTPTAVPTFINPNYQDASRPFGVSASERWVDVNLSTQTLRAYEGDTVVFSTLISSGTWEHPTVTGQFRVWLTFESQTMDGRLLGYDYYLEDVPYVMYFYQDYALHGTFWHSNFGTPMSHGCVNLETSDAAWIYNFVSIGTLVNVHY